MEFSAGRLHLDIMRLILDPSYVKVSCPLWVEKQFRLPFDIKIEDFAPIQSQTPFY